MAEHTPGPWTIQPLDGKYYGTKIWGSRIWELSERERAAHGPFNDPEDEADWRCDGHYEDARDYANARLIAAAPDMLAALVAVQDWLDTLPNGAGIAGFPKNDIDAAVIKATGG